MNMVILYEKNKQDEFVEDLALEEFEEKHTRERQRQQQINEISQLLLKISYTIGQIEGERLKQELRNLDRLEVYN